MLSTKVIKNVEQAAHYFLGQENYYTEGNTLAQEYSQWWGKGATALGLSGSVDSKQFTALLQGHLPGGQQLGKKVDGEIIHRPGFDLTFSVPKSVSILALLGEDERVFKAIDTATDRVLEGIEREQAKTRVRKDGILKVERTGNLTVARFLHHISRDGDPQLHTHCVVMNATKRQDGQWRSLASKLGHYAQDTLDTPDGFLEAVRHHQKYYGALFRAELAYEMQQLGYTIEKSGAHGFFEIAGISRETIALYSQRRREIEAYLKSQGLSGAKAAELANLKTRRAKQAIDERTLKTLWETRAALQGILAFEEARGVVAQSQQQAQVSSSAESIQPTSIETLEKAKLAIKEAIAHLSETQVALKETDLLARAIYYGIGDVPVSALIPALQAVQQSGELIPITGDEKDQKSERHFTTPALLGYEKALLEAISSSHSSGQSIIEASLLKTFLQQHHDLTHEQQQAIRTLFSSDQQFMALIGPTGSGKTHLIEPMMTLAKIGGYQPILLTSKQAETIQLQKQIQKAPTNLREWLQRLFDNKQFDTVFSYLKKSQETPSRLESWVHQHLHTPKKPMIFVDNATQLSSRQVCELRAHVQQHQGQLVLIGDPQTALTWRTGTPLTQLLAHGILTAELTGQSLKPSDSLKTAITHSLQKNIVAAFQQIGQRLISIEDREQRHAVMAAQVAGLSAEDRARTVVLAPTQAVAHELNVAIRDALKISGEIDKNRDISLTVLLPHYVRLAEQHTARHYSTGQWIRFHQDHRALRVRRGDYCRIEQIDSKNNELLLKNSRDKSGRIYRWNPDQSPENSIEVFDEKTRAIAAGDTLLCHRSNKAHGLVKGDRVMVTAVTEHHLTLRHESSKTLPPWKLSEMASRHWDYGMALTPLQASHRHPDIVIAYQNSQSRQSHQRAFYHLLAQAGQQAWIYTENSTQLLKTLEKHTGDKLTAIEALLHHPAADPKATPPSTADYLRLLETAVQNALQRFSDAVPLSRSDATALAAKEAVQYALAYLSEKEAAFEHKEVMTVALTHVLGRVNQKALQQAVLEAEKQGELIRGVYSENGTRWTTREALTLEREIVRLGLQDRGALPPRLSPEVINNYLEKTPASEEHARVLRELAAQKDRIVLLQGFAGTGKTTLLQHIEQLQHIHGALQAGQEGKQALLCLAPTHAAVKEIPGRGLEVYTLDRFLLNVAAGKITPEAYRGRCLVVDESSMISNQRLHDFLKAVIQLEAWGMLVGDIHQYTAVDSGKPYELLQRVGLSVVHLTEITRQKEETLQAAVKAVYQKDFSQVFQVLENRIIEVGGYIDDENKRRDNRAERMALIAEDYVSRDVLRRSQTQIITFGNEDRVMQNDLVREGLILKGELTGPRLVTDILVSRRLSEIERSQVGFYHVGDVLRFNISQSGGIHKGEYWTVAGMSLEGQHMQLERPGRDPVLWKPQPYRSGGRAGVEVYETERRELMAGDLIRWTRTDEALGLLSPELARVEAVILPPKTPETLTPVAAAVGEAEKSLPQKPPIEPAKIMVRSLQLTDQGLTPAGNPIELASDNPRLQHWDHAYAITGYGAQGKTIRETLINAESYRPQLTSQRSLLVVLTRATHQVTLYTDDKTRLLQAVQSNPGRKSSALEAVGEIPSASTPPQPRSNPEISQDRRSYDQRVSKPFYPDEQAAPGMSTPDNPDAWRLTISQLEDHPDHPNHPDHKLTVQSDPIHSKSTLSPRLDAQRISQYLTDQAERVVEQLLGEPKTKTGGQYRYGSKQGSLIVTLTGDKRGLWHDFQTGEGGHLLDLIAFKKDLDKRRDFRVVLQEALKILGTSPADITVQDSALVSPSKPAQSPPTASPALTSEQQRSLNYARRLAKESQPIAGTLAERYLREHRGIALDKFPDSVRFHRGIYSRRNESVNPALLVVAKDSANQVQAVQAIFLDKDTAQKADVEVKKQTWGRPSQGSVALQSLDKAPVSSHGVTYLAEGPETALSVYQALGGADVRITLGKSNFKNIDPAKTHSNIVLCLDNDGHSPQSDRLIRFAAEQLQQQGKTVWMVQPKIEGQDYNDVLKEQGAAEVKTELQQAVPYANNDRPSPDKIALSLASDRVSDLGNRLGEYRLAQEKQVKVEGAIVSSVTEKIPSLDDNKSWEIKDQRPSPAISPPQPQPLPQRERELELDL